MRIRRGFVLAAAVLTSALVLAGCARDTGTTEPAGGGGTSGEQCARNPAPTGGAAAATPAPAQPNADGSGLKVGLAYDIGGRGDGSFNDAAAAGLEKAISDLGVAQGNVKELAAAANESEDAAATRLRQLVSEGYNPIIAVGFKYATALGVVAAEAPQVQFAIVDDSSVELPNVTPLIFAEEQGSFLVGAAAALKTTTCKIGFVGGVEQPLIQKFEAGYVQGAKAVAPDIEVDVKYLSPAGDFTGFNDPAKGQVVAGGELDGGADVIYHAAGASGQGVFQAVKAADKLAIGVDSDQYNVPAYADTKDIIMTSMLKRVDVAVFDYINAFAAGDTSTLPEVFDLKVDGVGYATSGGKVDDIAADLDAYKAAIISGSITVETTP
ncbi:BMP family lipoprotein [Pseudonocardia lacus]|uniref:BMP family lipoprotein n=1 Tax=Pseudonocardia lacus TaxID=2835865 RepID=UPI001BDC148E|nr:BMP family ABC transporter substrate-binding protein [Pseudonocardia lacus]